MARTTQPGPLRAPRELDSQLLVERHQRERQRADAEPPRLPFGDGWCDEVAAMVPFHGTSVGLRRHAAAGQPPCAACEAWLAELIDADLARTRKLTNPGGND